MEERDDMNSENGLPKCISNVDTVNILSRIEKLRLMHTTMVANRFNLNLTEVKIIGYIRNNALKGGIIDILECNGIGETSICRSINKLEKKAYIHRKIHPYNHRSCDLVVAGEGNFIASYILLEQKRYLNEIFTGFTHDERVVFGKMLWKINKNAKQKIAEYQFKRSH